ncbi:MAG: tetratricopeptide repeat protein [candidate division KSB1 bacterium]|nr:tetratricopeptide repeat protein [candidate division KSB1 bacterium]MDZ7368189.1 tetratricopeptide repeat protein [candidate division KSB1 bacterium]MDZ7405920.1 tetratricopeptide repeat protein [candidate division KSB1 bacterium]
MRGQQRQTRKWLFIAFVVLVLNSGYLAAFAEPTVFYMLNVLLHVVLGVALIIPFFILVRRYLELDAPKGKELAIYMGRLGYWCLAPCLLTGLYLTVVNATHSHRWVLYFHIASGFLGVAFFQKSIRSVAHKVSTKNPYDVAGRLAWITVIIAVFVPLVVWLYNLVSPRDGESVTNPMLLSASRPELAPVNANSLFAPSAASTSTGKIISSQSLWNAESCGRAGCHPDVYQQWQSSAHHYSSLNNPWYRKSIEDFLESSNAAQADTTAAAAKNNPAKWCAGCHDPALLLSGKFELPLQEAAKTPEAHAGVSCTVCHSITRVGSTMGQADYVIEEMPLNDWATSDNRMLRGLYDYLLRLDPQPHRQSMMKPFHREGGAAFCSTCHKAHLDKPVNHFRWIRSFNDYDAWQAGPFSGHSSRGFYATPEGKGCVDCHMPLVKSKDAGHAHGKIRSHRFPGANTALPLANNDETQLRVTSEFLRGQQVSVDIFALGKPYDDSTLYARSAPEMIAKNDLLAAKSQYHFSSLASEFFPATLFAIGDEQLFSLGSGSLTRHPSKVIAPINRSNATVARGEEVRVDIVVRSQQVGHFFPSGKVDAHDVWLELKAVDDRGRIIFWSGAVADNGKGPVDSSAHFYRSYLVDHAGRHVDKNNTWVARQAIYVNLIPPGGADVAHYRMKIPADCGDKIHLITKLNYRNFSWAFNQWVFSNLSHSSASDSGRAAALVDQSLNGYLSAAPEIPIIEMARDSVTLAVVSPEKAKPALAIRPQPHDWKRWNDYGIGLLAQGDLKNAEVAFFQATQNAEDRAEPWINVGVVRLREGNFAGAQHAFAVALQTSPVPFKINFYYGLTLKALGRYDEALKYLKKAAIKFPRDRVAKIQRGHLYLLMKDYHRAIADFEKVLSIDPENVEAYYYLQQAYRAAGEEKKAEKAGRLYERFKANPPSFAPDHEANQASAVWRESRPLHEHLSAPLPSAAMEIPPAPGNKTPSTKQ